MIEITVGLLIILAGIAAVVSTEPPYVLRVGLLFGPVVLIAGVTKFVVYLRRRAYYRHSASPYATPYGGIPPGASAAPAPAAICRSCGTALLQDARFCGGCGRSV